MALYTIRLDKESEEVLARSAAARGVSRAVVLREAVAEYGKAARRKQDFGAGWERLVGTVTNGPGNLSQRTGERFAEELLKARAASAGRRVTKARKRR